MASVIRRGDQLAGMDRLLMRDTDQCARKSLKKSNVDNDKNDNNNYNNNKNSNDNNYHNYNNYSPDNTNNKVQAGKTKDHHDRDPDVPPPHLYPVTFQGWTDESCDRLRALLEEILSSNSSYAVFWNLYIHLECSSNRFLEGKKVFFRAINSVGYCKRIGKFTSRDD